MIRDANRFRVRTSCILLKCSSIERKWKILITGFFSVSFLARYRLAIWAIQDNFEDAGKSRSKAALGSSTTNRGRRYTLPKS